MDVRTLITGLPVRLDRGGRHRLRITGIVDDSRRVTPGALFVARHGTRSDGRRFIEDAVSRGAAVVLTDTPPAIHLNGTALLLADDPVAVGYEIAKRFHADPAASLTLVAITGTNGKTTTAYMVRHLLASVGRRSGLIGTVEVDTGDGNPTPASLTTPGRLDTLEMLAAMVRHGCDTCVMETSSHALHQGRVAGLDFAAAVFTNLTGDHMDYHGDMDAYADAKAILFDGLRADATAIVNGDDPRHARMLRDTDARVIRFGFNLAEPLGLDTPPVGRPLKLTLHEATARYTDCTFAGPWEQARVRLPLIGRHNVSNMAGALGVMHALGVDVGSLRDAIASCPAVPGRLEMATPSTRALGDNEVLPFTVLVDYAHTDDALRNVLEALRPITPGRLRVLFGCGGDRDAGKRPRMAAVACDLADDIVITSDNPRNEDPQAILRDIIAGVPDAKRDQTHVEADRAEAIRRIINDAQPGDVVLIAGKGHEDYQIIGTEKRDFDDRLQARAAMDARLAIDVNATNAAADNTPQSSSDHTQRECA
ncbi:MAG: UDP-N-acetylmuramoyl-L-alanyl-D-glutamate--2,6-diaminopimelate ligase [Phycisphaera sp.]|nr:UDP-N-acetylmuramoyl-L-alanyl-D-glutamate--2,6-diaminopimelate ligase [Phycisphaera sp.]